MGVNMDLAPVVDVNTNPLNPVIGVRSFGSRRQRLSRTSASRRSRACSPAASAPSANTSPATATPTSIRIATCRSCRTRSSVCSRWSSLPFKAAIAGRCRRHHDRAPVPARDRAAAGPAGHAVEDGADRAAARAARLPGPDPDRRAGHGRHQEGPLRRRSGRPGVRGRRRHAADRRHHRRRSRASRRRAAGAAGGGSVGPRLRGATGRIGAADSGSQGQARHPARRRRRRRCPDAARAQQPRAPRAGARRGAQGGHPAARRRGICCR